MLSYKNLFEVCIDALNDFSAEDESVEEFIKDFMKRRKGLSDDDHTFIIEVFSGCFEFRKIIKVIVDGFYLLDGKNCLSSDSNLFCVVCYLILFRLDELKMAHMKNFVLSQDINKMHRFLRFFLSEGNLDTWIYSDWCKEYDSQFVQEQVMMPLLRWKPQLDKLVNHLKDIVDNKISLKKPTIPVTDPRPFNITQPKPKGVPIPDKIPKLKRHKPVPDHIYKEPKEFDELARLREENRLRAEEFLLETEADQFNCANAEKSAKAMTILEKIKMDEESKLNFNQRHARPIPKNIKQSRPTRMNAAAILREGAIFRKKEGEQLEKLEKLLAGAKDGSEFDAWQQKKLSEDRKRKETDSERKRVEGKLSREEAIIARQRRAKENQQKVLEMKVETAEMMEEFLTLRIEEEEQMKSLVKEIMDGHENAKLAKEKLVAYKRKLVQEVNAESRDLMRQALEDAELEMRRKIELIQEIRAMESIPVNRNKFVDLSSTAGHALLSEMSIVELRERLCLVKEQRKAVEEQKRDTNIQEKQAKNDRLMEQLALISVHRTEMTKAAAMKSFLVTVWVDNKASGFKYDSMRQTTSITLHSRTYGHLKHAPESHGSGENDTDVTTGNYSYDPPYTKLNQPRNDESTSLTGYCSQDTKLDHGTTGQATMIKPRPGSHGAEENDTDVTTGNYDPPYTKLNQPRNDESTSLTGSQVMKLDHGTTGQGRQLLSPSCTRAQKEAELQRRRRNEIENDENLARLRDLLEQKKAEKSKLAKELEVKPTPSSGARTRGLARERKVQEANRWQQLESSQIRQARMRAGNLSAAASSLHRSRRADALTT